MDLACVPTRHMLYSLPIELHFNFSLINLICDWGCASSQILRMSINSLDGCLVCHMCCYRLLGCHADQSIKRQRGAGWKGHRQAAGRQHSMDSTARAAWSTAHAAQKEQECVCKVERGKKKSKSEALRWLSLKTTALFQVIEASYRHIKIIIIRLVECLQSGLKAW